MPIDPTRLAAAETEIRRRMTADGAPPLVIDTFLLYVRQLAAGETGMLDRTRIAPLDHAETWERLPDNPAAAHEALGRTVVIKLNGGLGTGMGLDRAKSLLPAKDGLSFLDIIARQTLRLREVHGCALPLLFMNSFRTDADTRAALAPYPALADGQRGLPPGFLQHRVPKLRREDLMPADAPADPELAWCPPGHGDIYTALRTTGLLDRLLDGGCEYAFVSNADNLGAVLDPRILAWFAAGGRPFVMEVASRTADDRKGGHVARALPSGLALRESAQCPPEEDAEFQNVGLYRYFNTNNLWLNLRAIRDALARRNGILGLPLICNPKTLDPAVKSSLPVYQLETAMGAALSIFPDAGILAVPRSRFAPVKTTDDLLRLWSDLYLLDAESRVVRNPARPGAVPFIKLGKEHFGLMAGFTARFPHGAPSLLACDRFEVSGDVVFGRGVVATGTVNLAHAGPDPLLVPDGSRIGDRA